ncbi:MAG: cysteine--tRNA ligase, partial [Patescibacteria group bacterium]
MRLLNTLTNQKEEFKPLKNRQVGIFVCGPTVYDYSHIGHARTYVIFDAIAKYLKYKGYKVKFVMNITDIDDKIIDRAKEEGKTWKEAAEFYEKEFMNDIENLSIDSVDEFARATEHIPQIIKQIKALIEKDYAYQTEDGIYFDISRFGDYGKLAKRTIEQAEDAISRIDESVKKKNKGDFALWRFSKPDEPSWPSPWLAGRPGWHIEDTAISEKYLGQQYDIHCGAQDLIFPHHEAEIAQQEAVSGRKPFVKYWLHSGFVTINGRKMSKSLKNFITIRDILKKYSAEALRF